MKKACHMIVDKHSENLEAILRVQAPCPDPHPSASSAAPSFCQVLASGRARVASGRASHLPGAARCCGASSWPAVRLVCA